LADSAFAFRTDWDRRILALVIAGALGTFPTLTAGPTKGCISATSGVALKEAGLTLALVALTQARLSTIGRIPTAYTENAELLHRTERRELITSLVGSRVTSGAFTFHTEGREAIGFTVLMASTTHAFRLALSVARTERRPGITPGVIAIITDFAEVVHTLAAVLRAIPIADALHAFRTVFAIKTNGRIVATATIGAQLTGSATAGDTGRGLVWTMGIFSARRTAQPADTRHTEWRLTTAARIIRQVAELAGIDHTLARRTTTVSIT
jgi:hypothetical protein